MTDIIRYAEGESSLGKVVAARSDRGLAMVEFAGLDAALGRLRECFPDAELEEDQGVMRETLAQIAGLIEHPETGHDFLLDMRGSEFEQRVWAALGDIPAGQTVTYGEIAARIGSPRKAREVAEACGANMLAVVVPCHRVVKKDGRISGYRWGFKRKRALLECEHRARLLAAA